ncbi:putative zinc finger BED domain-containing protein 6-like, partial [Triplophysa rosa]
GSRKQMIDEALVNMIIKDSQPFSVVEDEGFRGLIHTRDRTYVLPSRQALKKMVDTKYEEAKFKAKAEMEKVKAVSLTSDMWTSLNMDAYLAITCHYIDENDKLNTVLVGVEKFPDNHTAENIDLIKKGIWRSGKSRQRSNALSQMLQQI